MDVEIEHIGEDERELVLIRCRAVTEEVQEITDHVKSRQGRLVGVQDGMRYGVPLPDVHYIESVDGRTFLYTKDRVFETPYRIYELESQLASRHFLRISKSMLLNLMKVESIQSAFNGRFLAVLHSGEEVIVSRSYVKAFKRALKGE
ncbi:MAG: LytTR family transcriptional regulator DNA-binding domain-containing protein [Atopobiaceae bacterium]|nr:LytTR family transcriptional regulator DNA-binding domain-containing protein [Atopobiaceae bacterium]